MTHYDVDYSNMTPQAKHDKAIADTKDYLGAERFSKVMGYYRELALSGVILTWEQLALQFSMAGVAGYPITALHAEIYPFG